jgi:lauroyl/myristoyl acyltransferase
MKDPGTQVRRRALLAARVRAHVPGAAIPPLVRLRLAQDLRNPRVMAQARAHMEFLVGNIRPAADLDRLARDYVEWTRWRIETRWHHDRFLPAVRMEGAEHLAAGRDGAVVNFLHHGPFERLGLSVAQHGHHLHMMMAPWFFADRMAPHLRQHRVITERGCSVFSSEEGSAGVRRRLTDGELVSLATDMPGSTPVTFLGRRLLGTFGAARLAHETGKPVLVVTSHRSREDGDPLFRVHEPLRPEQFADAHALLDRMLRIHEPAVLDWPSSYEEPRSKWGVPADDESTTAA